MFLVKIYVIKIFLFYNENDYYRYYIFWTSEIFIFICETTYVKSTKFVFEVRQWLMRIGDTAHPAMTQVSLGN